MGLFDFIKNIFKKNNLNQAQDSVAKKKKTVTFN